MINECVFLWKNRCPLNSGGVVKRLGKRLITFFPLLKMLLSVSLLKVKGGKVKGIVNVERCRLTGNKKNLTIGHGSSLIQAKMMLHEEVIIGENVVINSGAVLLTASHDIKDRGWKQTKGKIEIDDYAWIATNVIILPGTKVGRGAVLGAGAVVKGEVPEGALVVGNPFIVLEKKRSIELDYSPIFSVAAVEAWIGSSN